jgi:uncharacterized protein
MKLQSNSHPFQLKPTRITALDINRGLAVLGMVSCHYVSTLGDGTWFGAICAWLAAFCSGKVSALFCILAGISWEYTDDRSKLKKQNSQYLKSYIRRSFILLGLGFIFSQVLWPTEILSSLALFMWISLLWRGSSIYIMLGILSFILAMVPLLFYYYGFFVTLDWSTDGSYLQIWSMKSATLRYFFINGSYPVFPFLGFTLLGQIIYRIYMRPTLIPATHQTFETAWKKLTYISLIILIICHLYKVNLPRLLTINLGVLSTQLKLTWVPVTIPFYIINAASASCVLALIALLYTKHKQWRVFKKLAAIGRLSLTHYILHITVAYPILNHIWPQWDWSASVGGLLMLFYYYLAGYYSSRWLDRYSYGPLEYLLRRFSK